MMNPQTCSHQQRSLLSRLAEFQLLDSVLVRTSDRRGRTVLQVVVPKCMTREILQSFHDDPTGGHLSRDKMLGKIRARYYWPNLDDDVKQHCRRCLECQKLKPPPILPVAPMHPIECSRPFELVSMDICGPYPISDRGNRYILVITDHFTKWVEAYPIPNQEAVTVGFCFESFVNTFGYPDIVLTDQGRNFESALIKEMCARLKIDKRTTSAYHPQCNGQTERFNRTMNAMLAQYVSANQKDWDVWIPSVLFAYRTAVHDSTGFSPYKLLFGREPKQPIDYQFPLPRQEPVESTSSGYFSALRRTLDSMQEQAGLNLRNAQLTQKAYHDRGVTADQFRSATWFSFTTRSRTAPPNSRNTGKARTSS